MDDTAQNPQGQNQAAQFGAGQSAPATPQQSVNPVGQTQVTTGNPEQAPVRSGLPTREAAPVDEAEAVPTATDDSASQPDEVSDAVDVQHTEAVDVTLQESHPQMEISKELKDAGIEKGEDAEREQLPEEQLAKADDAAKQPDTQTTASGISLASTPVQLEEVKKKNSVRNAIKWLAESLFRQLKKMQMKPEEQKNTW